MSFYLLPAWATSNYLYDCQKRSLSHPCPPDREMDYHRTGKGRNITGGAGLLFARSPYHDLKYRKRQGKREAFYALSDCPGLWYHTRGSYAHVRIIVYFPLSSGDVVFQKITAAGFLHLIIWEKQKNALQPYILLVCVVGWY